jgi:hypothetical protein
MVESPFDVAAFAVQRIAAPIVAFKVANSLLGPKSFTGAFRGEGAGAAFGKSIASSTARGFMGGVGAGAATTARVAGFVGGAGSAIGAVALPYAAAMTALAGAERAIFNPYINNMKQAESIYQNFQGVSFTDAKGSASTGRGIGYKDSMRMSQDITKMGIKDMMFSTGEFRELSDMGMRSGMMDNAKSGDIVRRVKEMSDQIKLVMAVSKDPNVQSAIESLAKLQMGGASGAKATRAYSQIGMAASVAGASVQRVMDTVGAQGGYLYAQNGMTPYLGQVAAANTMSSFAAANRMGLISPEQLSRMGGVEGATQSSLTAQINASQSTLGKMMAYNHYLGGGAGGSTVGSVANFGRSMSQDPIKTMGAMLLNGNQASAKMMSERGSMSTEDQIMMIARDMPGQVNSEGKISAETAAWIMSTKMGIGQSEIIAFLENRKAETSPETLEASQKARTAFVRDQARSIVEQDNVYDTVIGRAYNKISKWGRDVTADFAESSVDPVNTLIANIKESGQEILDTNGWFGSSLGGKEVSLDSNEGDFAIDGDISKVPKSSYRMKVANGISLREDYRAITGTTTKTGTRTQRQLMKAINAAADNRDMEAGAALEAMATATDPDSKVKAKDMMTKVARKIALKSGMKSDFMRDEDIEGVVDLAADSEYKENKVDQSEFKTLDYMLSEAMGDKNRTGHDNAALLGSAVSLVGRGLSATDRRDLLETKQASDISKAFGIDSSTEDGKKILLKKIQDLTKTAELSGVNVPLLLESADQGTLDDIMKDGGARIKGKDAQSKIKAILADKSKTVEEQRAAVNKVVERAAAVEGVVKSEKTTTSLQDDAGIQKAATASVLQHESAVKALLLNKSDIDSTNFSAATTKLDSAATTFERAVRVFAASQGIDIPAETKTPAAENKQNVDNKTDVPAADIRDTISNSYLGKKLGFRRTL